MMMFEEAERRTDKIRKVLDPLLETMDALKKANRFAEALTLADGGMDLAELEDQIWGRGSPCTTPYEQAAIIHRKLRDYDAEIAVLNRFLAASSGTTQAYRRIVKRLQAVWKLRHGTRDAPIPPPISTEGSLLDRMNQQIEQKSEAEFSVHHAETQQFLSQEPEQDEDEEASRRLEYGYPSSILNRDRWREAALVMMRNHPGSEAVADALLQRADKWGVLEPDLQVVDEAFESVMVNSYTESHIDRRTGEETSRIESDRNFTLWVSATTGIGVPDIDRMLCRLDPLHSYNGIIEYWSIPGDFMHGKAALLNRH